MNFWDSSALLPLIIPQANSASSEKYFKQEKRGLLVWWGTFTECISAITRLEREKVLNTLEVEKSIAKLKTFSRYWHEISPSDLVREKANRLLRFHPLRAADAFQLVSAIVASEDQSSPLSIITYDDRLAAAARKEGFTVLT